MIYKVPEGYLLNEAALQYLVADAESWEATAGVWEEAYRDISSRYTAYIKTTKNKLEEAAAEISRLKKKASRRWGLGVYAGYGTNGASVGIGLVWKVM